MFACAAPIYGDEHRGAILERETDIKVWLRKLARSEDLRPFRKLAEPLRAHDRERGSDLVRTLHVYFATGANASEAADRLFLYRNSMRYRLARVEALSGLDFKDPGARLALQLGLLAMEDEERDSIDEAQHP
jgi:DNA-binding PucR family transcriptional regulator